MGIDKETTDLGNGLGEEEPDGLIGVPKAAGIHFGAGSNLLWWRQLPSV